MALTDLPGGIADAPEGLLVRLKAIIFDAGDVLVRTEGYTLREAWERRLGLAPGQAEYLVFGGELGWAPQLGQMSDAERWCWVQSRLGLTDEELARFRDDFFATDRLDMALVAYIRRLRGHFHLGLLSNAPEGARRLFSERFPVADLFDSMTISAEEGVMKPDARIYRLALERAGAAPEEALFIDDSLRNIEGARALGIHTLHYVDPLAARRQLVALTGIEDEQAIPQSPQPPLSNAARPLLIPTYDGSGEATHPDITYFPAGWHGWQYWLVITPYPGDNIHIENPSILVSHDGLAWQEPMGITNPIALPGATFLADGDLVHDEAGDRLWVYYIQQRVDRRTYLMRKTSGDGVDWGPQRSELDEAVLDVPDYELLSPAVVRANRLFRMWSVDTGSVGCHAVATRIRQRTSADGRHWSPPADVGYIQPGFLPWHVDVIHVPQHDEFWMLVSAFPEGGSCHNTELFFARSVDGSLWTSYPRVALAPGPAGAWDCGEIYRSTLLYDAARDVIRVWYSANDGHVWRIGYSETPYAGFLAWLAQPPTSTASTS